MAEGFTVSEFPALFRMVPERQDVVSVKLDTLRSAALACGVIPRDDGASP
jgi:hypothetical protein